MKQTTRIQLEKWFDGECTETECTEIKSILEKDREARDYLGLLERTRALLQRSHQPAGNRITSWDQVARRSPASPPHRPARILGFPKVVLATAAILVFGMAIWVPFRQAGLQKQGVPGENLVESVEMVETDLEGATPVVYLDQASGWTVVWVLEAEDSPKI